MKKLTIEDKAKAYDIALDKIKKLLGTDSNCSREDLEHVFPELKESEDERIRKEITTFLRRAAGGFLDPTIHCETFSKWLAWLEKQCKNNMGISEDTKQELEDNLNKALEKETPESWNEFLDEQGEQKPNANCLLRWSEEDEKMFQCLEGIVKDYWAKAVQEKNEIKIREASNVSYFLKTIQKSPLCWIKCSDGLPNRDGIYLVVTDGLHNEVYDIARYDSIEGWHKASEIIYWMPIPQLNNKSIIEQKPAWSEDDEKRLSNAITQLKAASNIIVDDEVEDSIAFIKSLKDRVQPNQEWSEEDESMYNMIVSFIPYHLKGYTACINWLKSLKDRVGCEVNCTTTKEWSEEDESWFKELELMALSFSNDDSYRKKFFDWLKDLKDKYTWKPSDEQINALEKECMAHSNYELCRLLEQLKKLRKE